VPVERGQCEGAGDSDSCVRLSDTSRFAFFAISISFDPYGSLIPRESGRDGIFPGPSLTKRIHGLIQTDSIITLRSPSLFRRRPTSLGQRKMNPSATGAELWSPPDSEGERRVMIEIGLE